MFSEMLNRCIAGDRIACRHFYLQCYLTSKLERLFTQLKLEPRITLVPQPVAGSRYERLEQVLIERELLDVFIRGRKLTNSVVTSDLRRDALLTLKTELSKWIEELNEDIISLD